MVDTIKFSQMTDGGDIDNDKKTPGLKGGGNVLFNNPWTFLPSGTTAQRPAPSAEINFRLRFNTDDQLYEYYDAVAGQWSQLQESGFTQGPFLIYEDDPNIPAGQNLGALSSGLLKQSVTLGVATLAIATSGTDYWAPGNALTRTQAPVIGDDVCNKTYVDALVGGGVTSLQGTANQVLVNGTSGSPQIGALVLTLPQDIGTSSSPTFAGLTLSSPLDGASGGTGVNNGSSTLTLGGSLSTIGAFTTAFTMTGNTAVIFPTSGTLATTSQLPSGAALTKVDDTNVTLTLGGTPATALLQAVSLTLGWTGLLGIARGGTGVGSVTISPTASAFAGWDSNLNFSANNFIAGYATTATAAGNTTLTVASASSQFFTGSTTQTVTLPVASTLTIGHHFYIVNNSSGNVTINSSGGNAVQVMASGTTCNLTCILNSGTSAASWYAEYAFQSGSNTGTVNSGSINQLAWYAANGTAVSGLATGNNGVLITSAGGVPSISSTLPAAVQANITATGAVTGTSFNTITGVATQADQETATSIVTVVTPGRQQYHPSAAKVWVYFTTVTTTAILASYNVTSLTDGGTGITVVNYTTSFSSANYPVDFKCDDNSSNITFAVIVSGRTTGGVVVASKNNAGTNQDQAAQSVSCYGDQ